MSLDFPVEPPSSAVLDQEEDSEDPEEDPDQVHLVGFVRGRAGVQASDFEEIRAVVQTADVCDLRLAGDFLVAHEVQEGRLAIHTVGAPVAVLVFQGQLLGPQQGGFRPKVPNGDQLLA